MPEPRAALNGFPPRRASKIVGLSIHMLNYLARHGYVVPAYRSSGRRGITRYYSFRDLVVARMVAKLLDAGVEIRRLKTAISKLSSLGHWSSDGANRLKMLVTDGRSIFFVEEQGALRDITSDQLAFAFVLDVSAARREVEQKLSDDQRARFTLANRPLRYASSVRPSADARTKITPP